MAKRDAESEPLDEEPIEPEIPSVGQRLRAAREEKGLSLEDVAAQTRIPQRHLVSIEGADWDSLPAPTYTIGFAKNYAGAVGLDRSEIGNSLREEMGGQRFAASSADVFEPADPRRTMPKGLVIGAILAVVLLVIFMSWLNKRSLEQPEPAKNEVAAAAPAPAPSPASSGPATTAAAATPTSPAIVQGQVVLTATAPVWLQISEKGGPTLFTGLLQPDQTFSVPATAKAPLLKTGKPEALKITVGNAVAPPVGPPATTVSHVSLLPADLMKAPAQPGARDSAPAPKPGHHERAAETPPALPPDQSALTANSAQ